MTNYADMTTMIDVAAVAEFTPMRLLRKAITTAAALAQGKDVPSRVELPINRRETRPATSGKPAVDGCHCSAAEDRQK